MTGRLLGIPAEAVLVGSTGVIGMQLPMDRIEAGIAKLVEAKSDTLEAGHTAACSIMTTDTISKEIAVSFEPVSYTHLDVYKRQGYLASLIFRPKVKKA